MARVLVWLEGKNEKIKTSCISVVGFIYYQNGELFTFQVQFNFLLGFGTFLVQLFWIRVSLNLD